MDWVSPFYTQRSAWLGPSGVLEHHRARAASIERLCGPGAKRILELGAGAGGTAAALAELGHAVVAVELSPLRAHFARQLAEEWHAGSVEVIEGDFYTAEIPGPFDVVGYWDGFGVGTDDDQRRLLRRVATDWLASSGAMLVDVYNPLAWVRLAGQQQLDEDINAVQQRDFDPVGCRFVDRWWPVGEERQALRQSIRCYAPVDFLLLLEGTGLEVRSMEVSGQDIDVRTGDHTMLHPLADALSYHAQLAKSSCAD